MGGSKNIKRRTKVDRCCTHYRMYIDVFKPQTFCRCLKVWRRLGRRNLCLCIKGSFTHMILPFSLVSRTSEEVGKRSLHYHAPSDCNDLPLFYSKWPISFVSRVHFTLTSKQTTRVSNLLIRITNTWPMTYEYSCHLCQAHCAFDWVCLFCVLHLSGWVFCAGGRSKVVFVINHLCLQYIVMLCTFSREALDNEMAHPKGWSFNKINPPTAMCEPLTWWKAQEEQWIDHISSVKVTSKQWDDVIKW